MRIKNFVVLAVLAISGCATVDTPLPTAAPQSVEPDKQVAAPAAAAKQGSVAPSTEKQAAKTDPHVQSPIPPAPVESPKSVSAPLAATPPIPSTPIPPIGTATPSSAPAAAKPVLPTSPNSFSITAGAKTSNHPFFGQGSNLGFSVNGQPGKELVLTRGGKYIFSVDTGVQHDFYFTTEAVGWGAGTVTDGIDGQFTYKGEVTFEPKTTTPSALYYACRNHKFMGGKIYVLDRGETIDALKKRLPQEQVVAVAAPKVELKVSPAQVKQKIAYAELMVASSEGAKRVEASNNVEAKNMRAQAQKDVVAARGLLDAGDVNKAISTADQALRLMTSATQLVPVGSVGVDHKARYDELLNEVKAYEKSYLKHQSKEAKNAALKNRLDLDKFRSLVKNAEGKAAEAKHEEANKMLSEASTMIVAALSVMLDSETVVYDKEFGSPQEEYEYELARYQSYLELVPIAIEQRQSTPSQVQMMDEFVKKGERIVREGKAFAGRNDFTTAIQAMQAATDNVRRALTIAGVR